MTSGRPTAKQAIEVLKVHQLRRENAVIFQEIKGLREDVANRQSELNQALIDLSGLRHEVKVVQQSLSEDRPQLQRFETSLAGHGKDIETVRQAHIALRDEVIQANALSVAANQQNRERIKELLDQLPEVKRQIETLQAAQIEAISKLQSNCDDKTDRQEVEHLENKLEDFMQVINEQLGGLPGACRPSSRLQSLNAENTGEMNSHRRKRMDSQSVLDGDSSPIHWDPIDSQTALQEAPPPQPETYAVARIQGEEDLQTPTTLRSTAKEKSPISNIAHDPRPIPREIVRTNFAPEQCHRSGYPSGGVDIDCEPLQQLLRLHQSGGETLPQYLARFRELLSKLPTDPEVVSACLRRFVMGVTSNKQRCFVHEWLRTGDWTMAHAKDCILLLKRGEIGRKRSRMEPSLTQSGVNARIFSKTCKIGAHNNDVPVSHSSVQAEDFEMLPVNTEKMISRLKFSREAGNRVQRVQPARSAKTLGRKKVAVGGKRRKQVADALPAIERQNQRNIIAEVPRAKDAIMSPIADAVSTPERIEGSVDMSVKPRKGKLAKELEALSKTQLIEKRANKPTLPTARSEIHEKLVGNGLRMKPNFQNEHDPQGSPLTRELKHAKPKRVPTLVKRPLKRVAAANEMSDAIGLPPMPHRLQDHEQGRSNGEDSNRTNKRRRETPPEIPILALSTSDFRE